MKCSKCNSRDIDFQESSGQSICVNCGTVLEENTIVSSIEFQESGDRSHVIGQYISATCSKPYSGGGRPMGRHGDTRDPRDTTLVNARRSISHVASSLRLPPLYIDRAYRLYQLALQRNFIFGRKQLHVVATCLYIICRQEKSPHLLIDFSDALQINVYVLGKSFLQFSKLLNLNLPVVDPSLYIHRYATRLELGESRASVVATALRIISRLKKDWIATGRRPDGICALAMLVSARAHDFDVNQDTICKLFRVSPDLLRRRIADFRSIPSAQLTLEQFHTFDTEVEFDPPAYVRGVVEAVKSQQLQQQQQEQWEQEASNNHGINAGATSSSSSSRGGDGSVERSNSKQLQGKRVTGAQLLLALPPADPDAVFPNRLLEGGGRRDEGSFEQKESNPGDTGEYGSKDRRRRSSSARGKTSTSGAGAAASSGVGVLAAAAALTKQKFRNKADGNSTSDSEEERVDDGDDEVEEYGIEDAGSRIGAPVSQTELLEEDEEFRQVKVTGLTDTLPGDEEEGDEEEEYIPAGIRPRNSSAYQSSPFVYQTKIGNVNIEVPIPGGPSTTVAAATAAVDNADNHSGSSSVESADEEEEEEDMDFEGQSSADVNGISGAGSRSNRVNSGKKTKTKLQQKQKLKKKVTSKYIEKQAARKALYEQVYEDITQDCMEAVDAGRCSGDLLLKLQSEAASVVGDNSSGSGRSSGRSSSGGATRGEGMIGGWGTAAKGNRRLKERKIVLSVQTNGTTVPHTGGAAGSNTAHTTSIATEVPNSNHTVAMTTTTTAMMDVDMDTGGGNGEIDADAILGGELDRYILSEEEQKKRTLIWEKTFRPFMEDREKRKRLREGLTAAGATHPADATNTTTIAVGAGSGASTSVGPHATSGSGGSSGGDGLVAGMVLGISGLSALPMGLGADRYTQSGRLRRKYTRKTAPNNTATAVSSNSSSSVVGDSSGATSNAAVLNASANATTVHVNSISNGAVSSSSMGGSMVAISSRDVVLNVNSINSSTGSSASVRGSSKKINYAALRGVYDGGNSSNNTNGSIDTSNVFSIGNSTVNGDTTDTASTSELTQKNTTANRNMNSSSSSGGTSGGGTSGGNVHINKGHGVQFRPSLNNSSFNTSTAALTQATGTTTSSSTATNVAAGTSLTAAGTRTAPAKRVTIAAGATAIGSGGGGSVGSGIDPLNNNSVLSSTTSNTGNNTRSSTSGSTSGSGGGGSGGRGPKRRMLNSKVAQSFPPAPAAAAAAAVVHTSTTGNPTNHSSTIVGGATVFQAQQQLQRSKRQEQQQQQQHSVATAGLGVGGGGGGGGEDEEEKEDYDDDDEDGLLLYGDDIAGDDDEDAGYYY